MSTGAVTTAGTTTTASQTYNGPLPLPAGDGKPMLWPAPTKVSVTNGEDYLDFGTTTRYGFVNANGVLVVPPRYEAYEYCHDGSGRVAFIAVSGGGRKAAVLDLAGTVIRTLPTDTVACGPAGTVVFTYEAPMDDSNWRDGLMQIATGRVLLPLVKERHIRVVDDLTVNVSDRGGEYFLDVVTGKRTPHPGEVTEVGSAARAPGVPASLTVKDGDNLIGFLDTAGRWVVAPQFTDAYEFVQGFAMVELTGGGWTFINPEGEHVGGVWSEMESVAFEVPDGWRDVGYLVTGAAGQGLLSLDLRTVVEPGPATITCDSDAAGACAVVPFEGNPSLVRLPEGTVTSMPDSFDRAVGPGFLGHTSDPDEPWMDRIVATATGAIVDLGSGHDCRGVGTAWAACSNVDTVVLDTQGRRTVFRTITPLYGPDRLAGVAYYWATTARWEGIVDADGTWHYRQFRFTRLED